MSPGLGGPPAPALLDQEEGSGRGQLVQAASGVSPTGSDPAFAASLYVQGDRGGETSPPKPVSARGTGMILTTWGC